MEVRDQKRTLAAMDRRRREVLPEVEVGVARVVKILEVVDDGAVVQLAQQDRRQKAGVGDDQASRKEKIRLLKANIEGTSHAFFDRFSSDSSMWLPGTDPKDVEEAKAAIARVARRAGRQWVEARRRQRGQRDGRRKHARREKGAQRPRNGWPKRGSHRETPRQH